MPYSRKATDRASPTRRVRRIVHTGGFHRRRPTASTFLSKELPLFLCCRPATIAWSKATLYYGTYSQTALTPLTPSSQNKSHDSNAFRSQPSIIPRSPMKTYYISSLYVQEAFSYSPTLHECGVYANALPNAHFTALAFYIPEAFPTFPQIKCGEGGGKSDARGVDFRV